MLGERLADLVDLHPARRRLEQHAAGVAQQLHAERSISPATSSAAIGSARSKPVASTSAPAAMAPTEPNRSAITCSRAPSTLRLRRCERASATRAATLTAAPDGAHDQDDPAVDSGGSLSRRTASTPISSASASSAAPLIWADRISARRRPKVKAPARRALGQPRRHQRERDRARVGEHVGGVREQRQRVGDHAGHDLDHHEAADQRQRDGERAAVGGGHRTVVVVMVVVRHRFGGA